MRGYLVVRPIPAAFWWRRPEINDLRIGYCREVARTVAARHGVARPPVDVEGIALAEGMRVARVTTLGALDARLREDAGGWLIELNADRALTAQRFSVSHEIGHLKLNHDSCGTNANQERQANVFAAELLIPLQLLKVSLTQRHSLESLAALFQVSREAMTIKLTEQNLLLKLMG